MSFSIDMARCVGAGVCVLAAPEVFDQNDDDGTVIVLNANPSPELVASVRDAAARCPAAVITVAP